MGAVISLTDAKAHLSEVVRSVRNRREEMIITVDGEPAARLVPVEPAPRALTAAEVSTARALLASLSRIARVESEFDAVQLIGEGRR